MMATIKSILKDPHYHNLRDVFKLAPEKVYLLAGHPKAAIRFAAILHAPIQDVPLFINDPDPDIKRKVESRLKNGL